MIDGGGGPWAGAEGPGLRPGVADPREGSRRAPEAAAIAIEGPGEPAAGGTLGAIDYRRMLDALSDAVVAADGSHRIVYANAAAERLLGWMARELVGQPVTAIIPPRLHAAHRAGFKRYAATRRPRIIGQSIRLPALRRDGTEVDVEVGLSAVPDVDGEELIVASLRDLSERAALERQASVARQLKATAGIAARFGSASDTDGILRAAVSAMAADFDAALARAWVLDSDGGALRLRAAAGPAAPRPTGERQRLDATNSPSVAAEAARLGEPVVLNEPAGDPRFDPAWLANEGVGAIAAFPLRVGGAVRGVLVHYARKPLEGEAVDALAAFVAVVSAALTDIALLAREQAARAEAEAQRRRLQAILDTLPVGVVLAEDRGGKVSLVNPAGREIWGGGREASSLDEYSSAFPLETLEGVPFPSEDRPLFRALRLGERVEAVARVRRADGREVILEVAAAPLPGPDGGAVSAFRDVTAQRRVEAELARHAARMKALLDHLPVGVVYFDDRGICRACNGPASRTLAPSGGEVLDAPAEELLAPAEGLSEALGHCIADGVPHAWVGVAWPDPAGGRARRYLDWRFEPLPTDPPGALALIVDVTDRTLAESALQEAKEAAERASRLKTQFLSAVSHDLRTPVNAISLQAELLGHLLLGPEGPTPDELRDLASDLRQAARGLVELINDLLDLTRFDSGTVEHHLSEFPLEDWLAATLGPLEPTARAKGLAFFWSVDRPGRVVRADRVKLGRVLTNLVGNAIKFTEAGSIAVSAGADLEGRLALSVADTGPGIPRDQLGRIFDEFAQLRNPERDRTKGTGLGLAICRRLVEAVGGRLAVESRPGLGSTFAALYPRDHLPETSATHPSDAASPADRSPFAPAPGRQTILLVEDDDNSRRPLARLLEHAGFVVEPARDGAEALAALRRSRPSLALLDLMLPGLDGVGVLRALREDSDRADLPVIVLSGDIAGDRLERARALGISGLLAKPVDFEELRALLARLLPAPAPGS